MKDYSAFKGPTPDLRSRETVGRFMVELSDWWKMFLESEYARYRELIGVALDEYLASRNAAMEGMQNPNPICREAAIYVLDNSHKKDLEVVHLCEELIETETEEAVKICAMGYIAEYNRGSKDFECGKRFANIVTSEKESVEIRKYAYWCLLLVFKGAYIVEKVSLVNLRFPKDVDWKLVNACLK